MSNIALDYDKTFSADPAFWREFIRMSRARGHEVRIVTARDERFDCTEELFKLERELRVHWCRGVAKRWWMEQFASDWPVSIWIDDKPEAILHNSPMPAPGLATWRTERGEGASYGRA